METLERDGVKLKYVVSGGGDPAFVFVPGGSCDHWSFHEQHEHFSANHRCVSLDLRGHGQSDKPEQAYTMAAYADDVAWVINELGLDRPIVAGHSMGGAIGLQMEMDHPGTARALVLVDPAPATNDTAVFERTLAAMDRRGIDDVRRQVFSNFFSRTCPDEVRTEGLERSLAVPERVFYSELEGLRDWRGEDAARACTVPVLHIAATQPACPPHLLKSAIEGVVTGQTVGSGHFNLLEVPDQVNSMIEGFLREHLT